MRVLRGFSVLIIAVLLFSCVTTGFSAGLGSVKIAQSVQKDDLLKVYFNVLDDALLAQTGITADNLVLTFGPDALNLQSVSTFGNTGEGVGYIFAIDISKSLTAAQFASVRESLANLIGNMKPSDQAAIETFGETVSVQSDFTKDKSALTALTAQLAPTADRTQLYQAISNAVTLASRKDETLPDRRVIIILTDGMNDAPGGWSKDEALNGLLNAHIPLYTVGVSNDSDEVIRALDDMGTLSRSSGGEIFVTNADSIKNTYQQVFSRIDSVITAAATLPDTVLDGQSRHLQLVVKADGRKVTDSMEFRATPSAHSTTAASASGAPAATTQATPSQPAASKPPEASPAVSPSSQKASLFASGQTLLIIGAALLLILIILTIVLVASKKRKKLAETAPDDTGDDAAQHEPEESESAETFDKTVGLYDQDRFDGKTVALIKKNPYVITLTERRDKFEKVHRLPLSGEIIVGRTGGGGTLQISDNSVSGKHCRLALKPGGLYITDLGSTNMTKINGAAIAPNTETLISNGAVITLGRTTLKIALTVSDNQGGKEP